MASLKRGSTFVASVVFTENEWNGVYPWREFVASVGQESRRYELDYSVDANNMVITIESETDGWKIGPAKLDMKIITQDSRILSIPNGYSIDITVIEGVS